MHQGDYEALVDFINSQSKIIEMLPFMLEVSNEVLSEYPRIKSCRLYELRNIGLTSSLNLARKYIGFRNALRLKRKLEGIKRRVEERFPHLLPFDKDVLSEFPPQLETYTIGEIREALKYAVKNSHIGR
jgi:hypothetical protein